MPRTMQEAHDLGHHDRYPRQRCRDCRANASAANTRSDAVRELDYQIDRAIPFADDHEPLRVATANARGFAVRIPESRYYRAPCNGRPYEPTTKEIREMAVALRLAVRAAGVVSLPLDSGRAGSGTSHLV